MTIKDKIIRFILICRNLGINPSISTFSDRKRNQKIFYILKKFGLTYDIWHNWYKHGPYSPQLADIYYQVENFEKLGEKIESTLSIQDRLVLERAKPFLKLIMDSNKLEYYASILFIRKDMIFFNSKKDEDTIEKKVAELKPNLFSTQSYKESLNILKNYKLA